MTNIDEFLKERNAALLSLDEAQIRAYSFKCGAPLPSNPISFWAAVHKARTGIKTLPREARVLSHQWLKKHGFSTWDDGDLEVTQQEPQHT